MLVCYPRDLSGASRGAKPCTQVDPGKTKRTWLAISLGAVGALGEGQKPESASGEARGGGGLGRAQALGR